MPRLLLRPGWVLTHLFVLGLVVLFANLGLWQLDRHGERQAQNDRIVARQDVAPVPLAEGLALEDPHLQPVTVTGRYHDGDDIRLSPRSRTQQPGFEVLTPLGLPDGRRLMVNRGWVPLDHPIPPPPSGEVALHGRLHEPLPTRQLLRDDAGRIDLVSNPDLEVLADQVPNLVGSAYLEVVDDGALAARTLPLPAEPVPLDQGNHLSYAVQWFIFATVGVIGYPLLLRRRIADEGEGPTQTSPPRSDGRSPDVEVTAVSK